MYAVLFTLVFSLLIPIIHIALIHILRKQNIQVKLMFISFLTYVLLDFIIIYFVYIDSSNITIHLISALSSSIFMSLFYMEFFSMIARGFSMRIITDIYLHTRLNLEQLMQEYANGKGIEWMIDKRVQGIKDLGLINEESSQIKLSSKSSFIIAYISNIYKRTLKLGKGG